MTTTTKTCIKCNQEKPIQDFCKDNKYKDGRRSDCNLCRNARRGFAKVETLKPRTPLHGHMTHSADELPSPERLPAAYLKRCADYWIALVGDEDYVSRIA